jgi:hypothetical protein
MTLALKQSKLDFLRLASVNLQGVFAQGMAMFQITDLPIGDVGVLAAKAGNGATRSWTTAITSPTYPRSLQVVFAASYDGGDVTVTGLDQFGRAQTETIIASAASTVAGVKIWKSITAVALPATPGSDAATFTLQTATAETGIIGLPVPLLGAWGMLLVDGVAENADSWNTTYHGFVPHTAPDASVDYTVLVPVDWQTYKKMVVSEQSNI